MRCFDRERVQENASFEEECLQCLQCRTSETRQDADDLCVICFTDRLGGAPCIQLKCGHIFHFNCVRTVLEKRWVGPRIVFQFMQCPLCRQQIDHPSLMDLLEPLIALYREVATKAKLRLEYDGLLNAPALNSERSEFFNQPEVFAMDRYMYVMCFKCNKAYFGGESRCQEALESSQYNPEELICGGCSDTTGAQVCARHGVDYSNTSAASAALSPFTSASERPISALLATTTSNASCASQNTIFRLVRLVPRPQNWRWILVLSELHIRLRAKNSPSVAACAGTSKPSNHSSFRNSFHLVLLSP
ncbi:hypothetical protein L596_011613 [Steinernema carpocapsae]|uniref:RCR-type E3 ubiquitin transferase n=1 Tax=Steinernema carpocapsae TaxID=34508 RepID=A0A4V6XWE2_STECR|nr:hypothetical protein L596_011613 [Steinernema carpocapsae]